MLCSTLFIIFSSFCIVSSIFVITSKNPIFSVLFLILTFACASCLLFIFNLDFLPISFIVIYVGAITVLFLFVLLMLNIKLSELTENYSYYLPFFFIMGFIILAEIFHVIKFGFISLSFFDTGVNSFLFEYLNYFTTKNSFLNFIKLFSNIKMISYTLFNDYLYCFFLSSLVLLLAMIGSITLTLKKQ